MDEARDAKEERARPVDRRVVRTKNAIRQAFFKLVDERDYDKVTVAALAREAIIDRKTFYLHYASIDDVVDEIIRENVGRIVAVLEREQGAKGERSWLDVENFFTLLSMDLAHSFVESRRRVFHLPVEELLWKVEDALTELLIEKDALGLAHLGPYLGYCVLFFCAGVISVYRRWLLTDSEIPLEEIAALARTAAFTGIEGVLGNDALVRKGGALARKGGAPTSPSAPPA